LASAEERINDIIARVVSGGTDQADFSRLNIWEEEILLGFVETVNFVDEEKTFFGSIVTGKS
jgi:hypothetical protein